MKFDDITLIDVTGMTSELLIEDDDLLLVKGTIYFLLKVWTFIVENGFVS